MLPWITPILNLTFAAPDIQKTILFLNGDVMVMDTAQPIAVEDSRGSQRRMWAGSGETT